MKNPLTRFTLVCVCLLVSRALATTYYVDVNSTNPTPPYTNWTTASTDIQSAIDVAGPGDTVLVTNGIYQTGGRIAYGSQSNRVAVTKPLTIQSINGPAFTTIQGNPVNDDTAVRCVYLTNNATFVGFTLTQGATTLNDSQAGGGVYCESASATVSNCVLTANLAVGGGGGAYGGTLDNCVLSNNSATYFYFYGAGAGAYNSTLNNCLLDGNSAGYGAGGADSCTLNNCTVVNNSSGFEGGGADYDTLNNCIVYYNSSTWNSGNYGICTLNDCCTTPLPDNGTNNIVSEPLFVNLTAGDFHLQSNSPCINLGDNSYAFGSSDLDGNPRIVGNAVDIGAYEYQIAIPLTVAIEADFTNVVAGNLLNFTGRLFGGRATSSVWNFGDGTTVNNQLSVSHSWTTIGNYAVTFTVFSDSYPGGVSASVTVHVVTQPIYYISLACTNPVYPYLSWDTAATNIQDALDADDVVGSLVLVSNGVYQAGARVVDGSLSNRVAVTMPLTVQSINGPAVTVIQGYQDTNTITGDDAIRCVYLASGATMAGFTLTGGATRSGGDPVQEQSGAGIWCGPANANVTNCILFGNSAASTGGGAYQGTFNNCLFTSNSVPGGSGGGAESAALNNCSLTGNSAANGGAADNCALINSAISGNSAGNAGGGLNNCTAINCQMSGNSAGSGGGAAENGTLQNCTLTANSASQGGAAEGGILNDCTVTANSAANFGGGVNGGTLNNCVLTGNTSTNGGGAEGSDLNYCLLTANTAAENGGGADASALNNCTVSGNSATYDGGGVNNGTLNNCALIANSSGYVGGGAEDSILDNCTLTGNSAVMGGGADSSTLNNCIAFYNSAPTDPNYSESTLNFSCTTPLPGNGTNDIIADPQLTDAEHIAADSPCIGAGTTNYVTGVDLDGQPWMNPPSIGCNEYYSGAPTGSLSVTIQAGYTNVAVGLAVNFTGVIIGHASMDVWDFGDGTLVTNSLSPSHSWSSAGNYTVTLTAYNDDNPGGVSATVFVQVLLQPVAYVSLSNNNPVPPYLTWDTAATNIQDAVDAVYAGGAVWVSNGVYQTGGRADYGTDTNRLMISKPLSIQSVNGPGATVIDGGGIMRCVYIVGGAAINGFTLTNGVAPGNGGGALCASSSASLSNCVLSANSAGNSGGGAAGGALINCILSGNSAGNNAGGGAFGSRLDHCTLTNNYGYSGGGAAYSALADCSLANNTSYYGGGAENSALLNCALTGNSTYIDSDYTANGGGASGCMLTNCVISGNSSLTGAGASGCTLVNCALTRNSTEIGDGVWPPIGGGANASTLINCTVTYNSANNTGGGVNSCTLTNCIVYFNSAPNGTNYSDDSMLSYCDATPLATNGEYNIDGDPLMADPVHISAASPCRGAGIFAATSGVDIDGQPWLNPPSIGCDEFYAGTATGALAVAISEDFTNVATGFTVNFAGKISGHAEANVWDFGDGTTETNQLTASHTWSAPGNYTVTFTAFNSDNPGGVTAAVTIFVLQSPVQYVALSNTNPVAPYLSWDTAATNIQDAVAAAFAGGTVLVSNGVYDCGGVLVRGALTNRVAVTKPLTLESVNGPAATVIAGYQSSNVVDDSAVRCVYLTNNVVLSGFTLTNGATRAGGDPNFEQSGGGAWCESTAVLITNCVLVANTANNVGGGICSGTLANCTLLNNAAYFQGGGAAQSTLTNCLVSGNTANVFDYYLNNGGGVVGSLLFNCVLTNNFAVDGGGAENSTLNNCTLVNNLVTGNGGGADSSILNQSTLAGNQAGFSGSPSGSPVPPVIVPDAGGGAENSALNNCILIGNYCNGTGGGADSSTLNNCSLAGNSASDSGGGANNCTLTACTLTNNSTASSGGGAEGGFIFNSVIGGNSAAGNGGGVDSCTVSNSTLIANLTSASAVQSGGGGASGGVLVNCILENNIAAGSGGGAYSSTLTNCLFFGNSAGYGGGAGFSVLENCTITENSSPWGGGVFGGLVDNSIVYFNSGANGNYAGGGLASITWNYSCTTPLPAGPGNITNDPAFVNLANGDFHLTPNSPCINSGDNLYVTTATDFGGNPRIVGGTVDIGAYEYQTPTSVLSYAWAQQYGLPTDGSVDYSDIDGTGMNNWQKWIAGLNPTNPASVLVMLSPTATNNAAGVTVTWQSVDNRNYYLLSATNLAPAAFWPIASNIMGQAGTTSYTDPNATNNGPYFYRVAIQ